MNGNRVTSHLDWLLASAARCHLLGAAVTVAMAIVFGWVFTRGDAFWKTLLPPDPQIGLVEAAALVDQQVQWQQRETAVKLRRKNVRARVGTIRAWLPESADWETIQQDFEAIAAAADVSVLDLDQGDAQVGARMGVLQATCRLRGAYPGFCRLLHQLARRDQPIWCHEIRLQRAPVSPAEGAVVPGKPYLATLSLRIPYAAAGTAAGKLLQEEDAR